VIAPSLIPIRAGDRVKTDRRDAKKLVRLYRAGELVFVQPPSPEQEGLRDLVRWRDDLRRARTAARHRITKQLLRHGHIYRGGKGWTVRHQAWVATQRLGDPLAQSAFEHMLGHLATLDAQLAAVDGQLERVASSEPWAERVAWLCSFRAIATRTALGLLAEIGDFRRFATPRELMSYLGLTPTEYSSGNQQHRGHITKGRQHPRAPAADRSGLELSAPPPPIRPRRPPRRPRRARDRRPRLAGPDPPVRPPPRADRQRETLDRRGHRGRSRARRVHLGSHGPGPAPPNHRGGRCLTPSDPNIAGVGRSARPS
jgi:hypothetical protein